MNAKRIIGTGLCGAACAIGLLFEACSQARAQLSPLGGRPTRSLDKAFEELSHRREIDRPVLGIKMSGERDAPARITSVVVGSAASEAGLRRGDVIEKINHQGVDSYRDVIRIIQSYLPNDVLRIVVDRDGRSREIKAVLTDAQTIAERQQRLHVSKANDRSDSGSAETLRRPSAAGPHRQSTRAAEPSIPIISKHGVSRNTGSVPTSNQETP